MPHGDYTGKHKNQLANQYRAQQKLAATQMSLVNQIVDETSDEPVDLMDVYADQREPQLDVGEDGEIIEVDNDDPNGLWNSKSFRANDSVESITVGQGTNYNLQEGQTYIVPKWVYDHLDEKGLVRH